MLSVSRVHAAEIRLFQSGEPEAGNSKLSAQVCYRLDVESLREHIERGERGEAVAVIEQQPQISQYVPVFLTIEERESLHDLERHCVLDEGGFQDARTEAPKMKPFLE